MSGKEAEVAVRDPAFCNWDDFDFDLNTCSALQIL